MNAQVACLQLIKAEPKYVALLWWQIVLLVLSLRIVHLCVQS